MKFVSANAKLMLLFVMLTGLLPCLAQTNMEEQGSSSVLFTKVIEVVDGSQVLALDWAPPEDVDTLLVRYADLQTFEHKSFIVSQPEKIQIAGLNAGSRYVVAISEFKSNEDVDKKLIWKDRAGPANRDTRLQKANSSVSLTGTLNAMDSNNFPFIFTTVSIESNNAPVGNLTKNDFKVYEDGRLQTDYFDVTPPHVSGSNRLADIVFVLDITGSMEDEISSVKVNMLSFIEALSNSGIDYRVGFVVYADDNYVYNNKNLYSDKHRINTIINGIQLGEHGLGNGNLLPEDGFDALYAAGTMNFRPGARRLSILITDAPNHYKDDYSDYSDLDEGDIASFTLPFITEHLKTIGLTSYVVGPINSTDYGNGYTYKDFIQYYPKYAGQYTGSGSLTESTNGKFYPVTNNFNDIVSDIANSIGNTYIVRYRSDNPSCDGQERDVDVVVAASGESVTISGRYTSCAAPAIQRTQATRNLSNSAQIASASLTLEAEITDASSPYIQGAICYYRTTGTSNYKSAEMTNISGDLYRVTIPASELNSPGLDYYIRATDGQVTSSDPAVDPSQYPYQIALLPNTPPQIIHSPLHSISQIGDVEILCSATDNTNYLTNVYLYYKEFGTLLYQRVRMSNYSGDKFRAVIPGRDITQGGLQYYIRATDNFGLSSVHGAHSITVTSGPDCGQTFETDFDDSDLSAFAMRLPSSWKIKNRDGSKAFCIEDLNSSGNEYSVLQGYYWNDFKLEMDATAENARSTVNENYFIMFGVQDSGTGPADAYYVIFDTGSAKIWRSISGQPATLIANKNGDFASGGSRRIRIERTGARILVYSNNALVFDLNDSKIGGGAIGFGSYKGTACFDNLFITSGSGNSSTITENFEDGTANGWAPRTNSRWEIVRDEGSKRYFLNTTDILADNGALGEMSIYNNKRFGDFTFKCDLKSEDAANGNSFPDLGIVYGYQDARNYYYVLFNGEPDETAIYQLEDGVRTRLDGYSGRTLEDGNYHHVEVTRTGGKVMVYYDSRKILDASDNTFGIGKIAVGSLNDSGYFDNIVIRGDCQPQETNVVAIPRGVQLAPGQSVEIPVYVTTESEIGLAQFTVEYDGSVLEFLSASPGQNAGSFAVTQQKKNLPFPPTGPGMDKNVLVQISGGGSASFSGTQQEIVLLTFRAVGSSGDETQIYIDKECTHTFLTTTSLKDLCGADLSFVSGSAIIKADASLEGRITYLSSTRPVKDVVVDLAGASGSKQDKTDSRGDYSFSKIQAGNYTLKALKSGDLRSSVSGSDALTILQSLGFIVTLSAEQKLAADVNGSGTVSGSDAVAVLRYLAFLPDGIAETGKWKFEPELKTLLINGKTSQNFDAWVLGDVTLNWGENNLMKSVSSGDFVFLPTLEQETMSIALVAGQSNGRANTGTLSLEWVDDNQNRISFQPAGTGTHFAINNENGKKTHLSFANVRGFRKGEKIGTFVIAGVPGERADPRIASLTNGTINDVAVPEKEILLGEASAAPDRFELFQNYPNPFNMQTAIKYAVPARDGSQKVSLKIYSIRGRLLRTLFEGAVEPGEHTANWDGTDDTGRTVSTGIYVVRFKSHSFSKSMKITVIK